MYDAELFTDEAVLDFLILVEGTVIHERDKPSCQVML